MSKLVEGNDNTLDNYIILLANLSQLNDETLINLTSRVIEFIINPSKINDFQNFLTELVTVQNDSAKYIKSSSKALLIFMNEAAKELWESTKLRYELNSLKLAEHQINILVSTWDRYYHLMAKSFVEKSVTANKLVDVDWAFGVTAASDTCDQIGRTYLQLKLTVDKGTSGYQDIFLELSLEQFYSFLGQIERCKGYLDLLTVPSKSETSK